MNLTIIFFILFFLILVLDVLISKYNPSSFEPKAYSTWLSLYLMYTIFLKALFSRTSSELPCSISLWYFSLNVRKTMEKKVGVLGIYFFLHSIYITVQNCKENKAITMMRRKSPPSEIIYFIEDLISVLFFCKPFNNCLYSPIGVCEPENRIFQPKNP